MYIFYIIGKPDNPRNKRVTCEGTRATVQWISSFNGGDRQTFNVFALNGHQGGNRSIQIPDMGENKTHRASVQNLQPSMTYVFLRFCTKQPWVQHLRHYKLHNIKR